MSSVSNEIYPLKTNCEFPNSDHLEFSTSLKPFIGGRKSSSIHVDDSIDFLKSYYSKLWLSSDIKLTHFTQFDLCFSK